jgi:hypothetical protein
LLLKRHRGILLSTGVTQICSLTAVAVSSSRSTALHLSTRFFHTNTECHTATSSSMVEATTVPSHIFFNNIGAIISYLKSLGSSELTLRCHLVLTKPNRHIAWNKYNWITSVTANCNGLPVCNRIASKLSNCSNPILHSFDWMTNRGAISVASVHMSGYDFK